MAVNRLCSSGLQGIVTTAQNILLDDCDFGIGGGVEVMSRGAYLSTTQRNGARMGDTKIIDSMGPPVRSRVSRARPRRSASRCSGRCAPRPPASP